MITQLLDSDNRCQRSLRTKFYIYAAYLCRYLYDFLSKRNETLTGILIASLPAMASLYFYFIRGNKKLGIGLLLISAFLLRMLMISLDNYVQDWDERFHALVAKNMIDHPFRPMLYKRHIMSFNPEDWSGMHIWVHKQPLFLWQMALSMKIFGINSFALRIPSALMGCIMVLLTYDIARKWLRNEQVAFIAALISTFSYYILELTSGWRSLEHNDVAFTFYMTCTFWAFTRYLHSSYNIKWAVIIGVFAGLSILVKWLTGLLIFGGWGLYLLLSLPNVELRKFLHLGLSIMIALIIFMPWQIYIQSEFPVETAIAYEHNRKHITSDLGHEGSVFYHLQFLPTSYNIWLIPFLIIGMVRIFTVKEIDRKLSIAFVAMIMVVFAFFSIIVRTKMPALVFPVSAIMFIIIGFGIYSLAEWLSDYWKLALRHRNELIVFGSFILIVWAMKPKEIIEQRSINNQLRNNKIHNAAIYKSLDKNVTDDYVIINTRPHESIELMFYKDALAYHWYPTENILDSLQALGHKFAAFNYENDQQQLPDYIKNDTQVLILDKVLK
jgi:4-amino-4-deoxy-L-arabinose transferase-like glycosyltransferase